MGLGLLYVTNYRPLSKLFLLGCLYQLIPHYICPDVQHVHDIISSVAFIDIDP